MTQAIAAIGVVCLAVGAWLRVVLAAPAPDNSAEWVRWRDEPTKMTTKDRLAYSIGALRAAEPDLVADRSFTPAQQRFFIILAGIVLLLLVTATEQTIIGILLLVNIAYISALVLRIRLFFLGLNDRGMIRISDEAARSYPYERLPRYTVLVPAFRETEVFGRLVTNLRALDYPREKLQVLLLLEADDHETIEAATDAVGASTDITIVTVPAAEPRTKPKALNYGLTSATGDLITIYDAEDRPDPLQLRKAAIAMESSPPEMACLQAQLGFFNPRQNLLTRWFTIEYRMWFNDLLPGLAQLDAPIPLGGTSNHFRRSALMDLGAWDPFNVTEDADLGVRLHRKGYRSGVLDSVTYEEANSDFINWIKQRSRWYKGYAQTLLVHLRHPVRLYREIGFSGLLLMCMFVGGTPLLAVMNPLFWATTALWFIAHPSFIRDVIPVVPYFLGLVSWVIGNVIVYWTWLLSARKADEGLVVAAVLAPLYWVMMAAAAIKATIQLATAPSFWEKTHHGLDVAPTAAAAGAHAVL